MLYITLETTPAKSKVTNDRGRERTINASRRYESEEENTRSTDWIIYMGGYKIEEHDRVLGGAVLVEEGS